MSAPSVAKTWDAIERALDDETLRALRPPATAAGLAKASAVLGTLPAPLRALLARHDGMREPLFLNVRLLPIAEIVKTWRMRIESSKSVPYDWSRAWIPITDADGDHVCLDAKSGRIVSFVNAGARARVIASSLSAWLERVPRSIRAERNEERRRAALLPSDTGGTKREREKRARVDGELQYFVDYVESLEREWKGPAPAVRVFDYRAVARIRASEVVARSLDLGHVTKVRGGFRTTPKGRRFRNA